MAVLQSTNVQGALCVNGVAIGGGKDYKYCCFTASDTWTPTQDLVDGDGFITADLVGGGGGGGSNYVVGSGCYRSTHSTTCCACFSGNNTHGAAGLFIRNDNVPITATDACTITVGSGGQTGSYTFPDGDPDNAGSVSSASVVAGENGGDTVAFGRTAYGGCGATSCVRFQCLCNGRSACVCDQTTLTCAGCYGGKPFWYNPSFTSADPFTGKPIQDLDSARITSSLYFFRNDCATSGNGIPGIDSYVNCSVYPACNSFASCVVQNQASNANTVVEPDPVKSQHAVTQSDEYNMGYGHSGNSGFACVVSQQNCLVRVGQSGSIGMPGIVVIRWAE